MQTSKNKLDLFTKKTHMKQEQKISKPNITKYLTVEKSKTRLWNNETVNNETMNCGYGGKTLL